MKIAQAKFSLVNHDILKEIRYFLGQYVAYLIEITHLNSKNKATLYSLYAKCINYLPRRFLWSFDRWYSSNSCFNKVLENFLKLANSPLKISTSLSSLSRTGPYLFPQKPLSRRNKARILTTRALRILKPRVSNSRGIAPKVHKCPAPGQRTCTISPGLPGGYGHRWNWLMH